MPGPSLVLIFHVRTLVDHGGRVFIIVLALALVLVLFGLGRRSGHFLLLAAAAGMNAEECRMVLRSNAVKAYGLERFGVMP